MSNGLLKLIAAILIASALFSCAKGDDPTKIKQSLEVAALSVQDITQYDFGPVLLEGTLNKTFTLVNTGRIAATNITGQFAVSAFNFKGGSFPGTGGSCSSTIAAGTACTIVVSFLPTYCSSFRDNLALTYFDGSNQQITASPIFLGRSTAGASGTLDTTFNGIGERIWQLGAGNDQPRAIISQPDGTWVVAGSSFNGTNFVFAMVRFTPDSAPDPTFGSSGVSLIPFTAADAYATALARQIDGKIVIVGKIAAGTTTNIGLVRLNANGTLDSDFGTGGQVITPVGPASSVAQAVITQPDSKILVAGYASNGNDYDFAILRYGTNGVLDPTFGTGGKVTTAVGSLDDFAYAMALQSDGNVVVAGHFWNGSTYDVGLVRYKPNGTLDTGFGTNGKSVVDMGASSDDRVNAQVMQNDNKILVAGSVSTLGGQLAVWRFNPNGTLDTTFGGTGTGSLVVAIADGSATASALALQSNNKIVLGGSAKVGINTNFAVVRLTAAGILDSTFGTGGKVTASFGIGNHNLYGLLIQANGKIVGVGDATVGSFFKIGLTRLWN